MGRLFRRPWLGIAAAALVITAFTAAVYAQAEEYAVFLFVMDEKGVPVLEIEPEDIAIKEDVGPSTVVSVTRAAWPLKVTVLVDNGAGTSDALVHLRNGLTKLVEGIPPGVPVSIIATAPNPRWLVRESTDPIQISSAIGRLTPDDSLARFSDALIEYSQRLDSEFRKVGPEVMQPYLPVLVSIATTHADGSNVIRENMEKMLLSLRKHKTWTHMVMVTPNRATNEPGDITNVGIDEGQNATIGKLVEEVTRGRYYPVTGSGTTALATTIMPNIAQEIALRYLKQMFQHRIVMQRPEGASGPMKNFALSLMNHPGTRIIVSTDGNMP
jgi:hypothetical protein